MIIRSVARSGVIALTLTALAATALAGCAEDRGPGYYPPYAEGRIAQVEEGTIVSYRPVSFGPHDTSEGTVIGGVGGAAAGAALAGRGSRGEGAILGAIGGAILGNAIASSDRRPGFAYTIRRRDGGLVEIAQADPQPIPVGARVTVSYGAGRARVAPLAGYGPPPPPPPPPPRGA
jgi:outer membrane lipoprotein SlyB